MKGHIPTIVTIEYLEYCNKILGLEFDNLEKIKSISLEYHHSVFNYDDKIFENFQNRFLKKGFNVFTWILNQHTRMVYINKGDVFKENPKHK